MDLYAMHRAAEALPRIIETIETTLKQLEERYHECIEQASRGLNPWRDLPSENEICYASEAIGIADALTAIRCSSTMYDYASIPWKRAIALRELLRRRTYPRPEYRSQQDEFGHERLHDLGPERDGMQNGDPVAQQEGNDDAQH